MSQKDYELLPLDWDTEYFGVSSARVNLFRAVDEQGQNDILAFSKKFNFVTIANYNNVNHNNVWIGEKSKSFLTDINIQYEKGLTDKVVPKDISIKVSNKLAYNLEVLQISKKAFRNSRFYNDPYLPKDKAKNIYAHWTENAFEKEDKFFVLFTREGHLAGYLLFSLSLESCVIELIAVDENYQGSSVGKSMIYALESFVIKEGIKKIRVGTQLSNQSASRFYQANGFKLVSYSSLYHLWRDL